MKTQLKQTPMGALSVTEAGEGTPLIAVHGALTSSRSFERLLEQPPPDCRVIAADLPGHGRSPAPPTRLNGWRDLSKCLVALLDALEIETAHLLGHSMGGGISAYTAAEHPQRIRSLILIDAATLPFKVPLKGRIPRVPVLGELVFYYIYGESMFGRFFRDDIYFNEDKIDRDRMATYYREFDRNRKTALTAIRISADPGPVSRRLSQIACPTLVLWGRDDPLIPLSVGEQTAAQIPDATLATISNCGHSPLEEATDAALRVITDFWQSLSGKESLDSTKP